ncbi:hypothetical protein KIN20_013770 [Parelaphostrongylus tenuis]|uniref:Uncharacterized protein n=1 Tax=Parelaphostrongylus tenuis TaxID=148309 RepID=A0AAD5ME12_PARTN|nr:hypothetical protein KIN20_013770 [Parelaphostrongylus tenuis]
MTTKKSSITVVYVGRISNVRTYFPGTFGVILEKNRLVVMLAGDISRDLITFEPIDERTPMRNHTIATYAPMQQGVVMCLTRHMSTRHQIKATLSNIQKHRDVRRCLSDGDQGLMSSNSRVSEPSTPKRSRHTTDISPVREHPEHRDRALTELSTPHSRHVTETSQEDIPSLNEIEDDVIVDVCELEQEEEDDDDDDDDDDAEHDE